MQNSGKAYREKAKLCQPSSRRRPGPIRRGEHSVNEMFDDLPSDNRDS